MFNKSNSLTIGGEKINPGESLNLALPLPELFSCAPIYMPIKVICGKQEGPTVLIVAAANGDELNGTEIINQIINSKNLNKLKGTLIAVPVLNVYGLMRGSRHLPESLAISGNFPGGANGNHAARLAHLFTTEIVEKVDYCIDLQTGFPNHTNLPMVYADTTDENSLDLAKTFKAPVISHFKFEEGTLGATIRKRGVPYILYEAGEAMRFDEPAIKMGTRGIMQVLRKLKMLPESKSSTKSPDSAITERCQWVRTAHSGIAHIKLKLGQLVKKGQLICEIQDPFGAKDTIKMHSPFEAIVIAKNNLPLVHEGEAVVQLALFDENKETASEIKDWEAKTSE